MIQEYMKDHYFSMLDDYKLQLNEKIYTFFFLKGYEQGNIWDTSSFVF